MGPTRGFDFFNARACLFGQMKKQLHEFVITVRHVCQHLFCSEDLDEKLISFECMTLRSFLREDLASMFVARNPLVSCSACLIPSFSPRPQRGCAPLDTKEHAVPPRLVLFRILGNV